MQLVHENSHCSMEYNLVCLLKTERRSQRKKLRFNSDNGAQPQNFSADTRKFFKSIAKMTRKTKLIPKPLREVVFDDDVMKTMKLLREELNKVLCLCILRGVSAAIVL